MHLGHTELARRDVAGELFRREAAAFSVELTPVVSRDGHEVIVAIDLTLRLVDRPADVELFREQMLSGNDIVTIEQVRQRLAPLLEGTLREFVARHDAANCESAATTIEQLLYGRANEIGFGLGIEFVPPTRLRLRCPSLESQRAIEQIEKQRTDQLDRATAIVERVRQLGSAHELRNDEQASLLQLLLRSSKSRPLTIAAGGRLLRFEPDSQSITPFPIESNVGPIRSVRCQGKAILVGGQNGVAMIDEGKPPRVYAGGGGERGINSAVIDSATNTLVATHTEHGILRWRLDSAEPLPTITAPGPARFVQSVGDRIIVTAGESVGIVDGESIKHAHSAPGAIVSMFANVESIWIFCAMGTIDQLSRADPSQRVGGFARGEPISAAAPVEVDGLSAVAIADELGHVEIVSRTGFPLLRLSSTHRGIRLLARTGRWICGVSADRQQLITWDSQRPESPVHSVNILARFGNRITDIC